MARPTEPRPRENPAAVRRRVKWSATSVLAHTSAPMSSGMTFDEVMASRVTQREFQPVAIEEALRFFSHLFSVKHVGANVNVGRLRKVMASAGALHPIEIIIVDGPSVVEPILFDDDSHRFITVNTCDKRALKSAVAEAKSIVPTAIGHMVLIVGDKRRVDDQYENSTSLLWRDAGAALQSCSMSATAYGYGFCPLGLTGGAVLDALEQPHSDYEALGLAVFGK